MNRNDLRKRLKGPIAALVTPFDQEGRLSPAGLRKEIQFLLAAGIKVLVCNGSIGEFSSLTISERKQVLEGTLKHAGDKALVVAGCASSDLETALELSDHAAVAPLKRTKAIDSLRCVSGWPGFRSKIGAAC
jgi:N-acetylneuraminate lyase